MKSYKQKNDRALSRMNRSERLLSKAIDRTKRKEKAKYANTDNLPKEWY